MTFREYATDFNPEELDALTAAYDAAWQQLSANGGLTTDEVPVLQRKLALVILAAACKGMRDAERLKEIGLRAVAKCTGPRRNPK